MKKTELCLTFDILLPPHHLHVLIYILKMCHL